MDLAGLIQAKLTFPWSLESQKECRFGALDKDIKILLLKIMFPLKNGWRKLLVFFSKVQLSLKLAVLYSFVTSTLTDISQNFECLIRLRRV